MPVTNLFDTETLQYMYTTNSVKGAKESEALIFLTVVFIMLLMS